MKKNIKKILIIEFIILAAYVVFVGLNQGNTRQRVESPLEAWKSDHTEFEDGKWYIDSEIVKTNSLTTFLYGPYIEVPKGDYTVTVCYECDSNQKFQPFVYEKNVGYLKSSVMTLDKSSDIVSCDFRVTEDVDNFQLTFWYNGRGKLSVSGISIDRNNNDLKRNIVYLLVLFLLVDFFLYFRTVSKERKKYLLSVLGILFISSIPLFYTGLDGHDLLFHLTRIDGIARELSYGNFPVRMQSVWMAEYGYPVSVYYGDWLLYIPAVFRLLGFTIDQAYRMFVLIMNFAGVMIAQQCFKRIFQKESTALSLTLVYVTASYHLVDVYIRAAVGEYCALVFLPMLALAAYRIYCRGKNDTLKKNFVNASILAVAMTGIITAHVLSAEMVAFALLLVCIIYWKKTFTLNAIRTYVMAVVETLLLSAGFLVPFVDYYLNETVEITEDVIGEAGMAIQDKGASLGDFFAFFNNPFGDWYTSLFNPGIVLMLALIAAIALWGIHEATKEMKVLTVLSALILFMSTNVFPWNSLEHDFKVFHLLAQVQFPWRYVGIAILFLTLLFGFILEQTEIEKYLKVSKSTILAVCAVISVGMTCLFISYYSDNLVRNVYYDTANMGTWNIMGEEYVRFDADTNKFDGKIYIDGGTKYAEVVTRTGCEMDIYCRTDEEEGSVILPLLNYRGYQAIDDEGNQYPIKDSDNEQVSVTLPAGFDGTVSLRYVEPWYWTVSTVVSAGAVLFLGLWGIKNRKVIMSE